MIPGGRKEVREEERNGEREEGGRKGRIDEEREGWRNRLREGGSEGARGRDEQREKMKGGREGKEREKGNRKANEHQERGRGRDNANALNEASKNRVGQQIRAGLKPHQVFVSEQRPESASFPSH